MGRYVEEKFVEVPEDGAGLKFLYHNPVGRVALKALTGRGISKLAGKYLDSSCSKWLIPKFIEGNNIDLNDYEECDYENFNECFCRKIKPELRPLEEKEDRLMSPCDGLLSVYRIHDGLVLPVKQSSYSIASLLRDRKLAKRYDGGVCMVFRLCVDHYHRYSYPDSGLKSENRFISGKLHTVRPIALEKEEVFTENCREYTLLKTKNFGTILQMEVGAMLVGKIKNHHGRAQVTRGQEKGCFLYGGSTIIMLLQKDKVVLPDWMYKSSDPNLEIPVKMGQALGIKKI